MQLKKLPQMGKEEYDRLIKEQSLCRITYMGEKYPQVKPFIYVFDGEFIYILATKYGKKIEYMEKKPKITLEIENYSPDLSNYKFVTLSGKLVEVKDEKKKQRVRKLFVNMIKKKNISENIMIALGHEKNEPLEAIVEKERTRVFKLKDVEKITGLKNE